MMDREQRIDDFLLEKIPAEEAEAFERHVFGCPQCLAELRWREQMLKLIKEERLTAVAPSQRGQSPAGFLGAIADRFGTIPNAWIYAGVAAALLIAVLVSPIFRGKTSSGFDAANFAPVPQLESLMSQPQRTSGFSIAVTSPEPGENFTGKVSFRWEIKKDEADFDEPLALKILDNKEAVRYSTTVAGNEYHLPERLAPGLYYWTLEYQAEMLYLSKFFVDKLVR
ncbi:MAG: zf-HC2 domain-containing protein [bacterium]